jgi:ADP-ribose pyrophosphatase YjhB (NUDIX family)
MLQPVVLVLARASDSGLILAVSRPGRPNDLGLPGARVFAGESFEDAAKRGFERETGAKLLNVKTMWSGTSGRNWEQGRMVHLFAAEAWAGNPLAGRAGARTVWVNESRLCEARCSHAHFYRKLFAVLRERKLLPSYDAAM